MSACSVLFHTGLKSAWTHSNVTFKTSALRTADGTWKIFPSTQVSTRWSRNPLWSYFYGADVGHLPLRDQEPSPASQFIPLSLAILFANSLGADRTAAPPLCSVTTPLGSSWAHAGGVCMGTATVPQQNGSASLSAFLTLFQTACLFRLFAVRPTITAKTLSYFHWQQK